ncbi:MAG: (2Fe-2S)-binding protein [Flavobacteriales bacterium]
MGTFTLNINGIDKQVNVDEDTPLLWVLRDELNLLGTKYGCGIGECGACSVHINGEVSRSCSITVSNLGTKKITTIEGLSKDGNHPVQEAWKSVDVPQCGYCQSGQIMTAASFLKKNSSPTEAEIKQAMQGNLCRCGSYKSIESAVMMASKNVKSH